MRKKFGSSMEQPAAKQENVEETIRMNKGQIEYKLELKESEIILSAESVPNGEPKRWERKLHKNTYSENQYSRIGGAEIGWKILQNVFKRIFDGNLGGTFSEDYNLDVLSIKSNPLDIGEVVKVELKRDQNIDRTTKLEMIVRNQQKAMQGYRVKLDPWSHSTNQITGITILKSIAQVEFSCLVQIHCHVINPDASGVFVRIFADDEEIAFNCSHSNQWVPLSLSTVIQGPGRKKIEMRIYSKNCTVNGVYLSVFGATEIKI